jgi:hypothetical protein
MELSAWELGLHASQTSALRVSRCPRLSANNRPVLIPMTVFGTPLPITGVARVTVCCGLHYKSTHQIWASGAALAPRNLDRHRLGALQCLRSALGREGRTPGHAQAAAHTFAYPLGQQHVYRCWRPSAEIPSARKPRSVSVLVKVRRNLSSARTSITVSASFVGLIGN